MEKGLAPLETDCTKDRSLLLAAATQFIQECYRELNKTPEETNRRIREISRDIAETGFYTHTEDELKHGAKMAWRNSNRCIGRLFWDLLHVVDARHAETEEAIAEALFRHIDHATNQGKIRPVITICRPVQAGKGRIRIWNHQLIRYAGYESESGIVGDPISVQFTALCQSLGWQGSGTHFDVLPLVIQIGAKHPRVFPIPADLIKEVPIVHPEIEAFSALDLRWYAVPIVSNMRLEIGGLDYTAAPFNGWYMGTEIGARNFADTNRYNMLPKVASIMGLSTQKNSSLWKDRALVELNAAVLHSFQQAGVTIVDHHTAAQQLLRFENNEQQAGREVTGDWTWLIPPLSPAATHIFHRSYENKTKTPNFFYPEENHASPGKCPV